MIIRWPPKYPDKEKEERLVNADHALKLEKQQRLAFLSHLRDLINEEIRNASA
jgi:hypothetical protein